MKILLDVIGLTALFISIHAVIKDQYIISALALVASFCFAYLAENYKAGLK